MVKHEDLHVVGQKDFSAWLGHFYITWSLLEIEMCYAIGLLLKIGHYETHLITARMEFSRKAALLTALLKSTDHPNRAAILAPLKKIQETAKRNVFAHSFFMSNKDVVTFVERTWEGAFKVRMHTFTLKEFEKHAQNMKALSREFHKAFKIDDDDFQVFCDEAAKRAK